MEGTTATPDLQAILSTLAQFSAPVQNQESAQVTQNHDAQPRVETPIPRHFQPTPPADVEKPRTPDPRLRPQSRSIASPKPIDPATITTWQDGLRCVTKIAAQNAQFAATIKKMMADQRKHEMRWYSERQALKQKQVNRSSSSAQAHSILQSLGGANPSKPASDAESSSSNEAELASFDQKIYAAQVEMETAMTAELKGLGVPFFGTDQSLVVLEDGMVKAPPENQPKWSPNITEKQLLELRRRMVGHLEDLYRD
ncbi:uncharacterized protein LTR77_005642 [Saxophila tyrrhenica]|uniref:Uncharacterized protein n=1 Tax=Saxophila tyrrhenica TaxID=1690608 RepID=A0AAV9P926_9PEZI|nr:hypothetical protein LTR77_005642 [Saxophila tyrrhenica]